MTKSGHFLSVRPSYSKKDYSKLYFAEIVKLHGTPVSIILDYGTLFSSHFWKIFLKGLGTKVCFITIFHPQSDGQAERIIHTFEDMLRTCVINYGGSWFDHFPLIEFAYNNSYHCSIGMAPFVTL